MAGLENTDELFDLRMSDGAKPLLAKVKAFVREEVDPVTLEFFRLGEDSDIFHETSGGRCEWCGR